MSRAQRRRREALGRFAETLAVWSLRLRGYRIVARRYRTPVGEIDILARKGGVLVAAEVKARPSVAAATEAITRRQQDRIVRAALWFVARNPGAANLAVRFDVIVVCPARLPVHLTDAWRPEGSAL